LAAAKACQNGQLEQVLPLRHPTVATMSVVTGFAPSILILIFNVQNYECWRYEEWKEAGLPQDLD
jgi:hypothetical protein